MDEIKHRRVLLFPNGNQQSDTLSVFLDSVDAATQPKTSNWHKCVHFAIAIANPEDETVFKHSVAQHRYNVNETDWGFNQFVKLSQLTSPSENTNRCLVENDQTLIVVHMKVIKDETGVLWHNFVNYDSKKETGFVGLKNQGATCYMNSLLQSLYFTNYFRKATYAIPTEKDEPTKSIPLALQRVFYQLQHSDQPVGTTELTKSFGWDTLDSFMQHDVQEFNRVLQDNLESKMKGTKAEGAISRLFVGKYKSYIKCINVNFESSRVEDFYDIQLNVKGFKTLRDSFVDYVSVETLDGDNKYMAEGHGLQDARKGVIFTNYPPVLHLQLKRFEYDMERDAMVKINDRYEFPAEVDLTDFLDEGSRPAVRQNYHLHGVLVHSGDLHGGHYCAFIKSGPGNKWFKFDDDRVIPVTQKEVMEDNYGGESPSSKPGLKYKRFTNAYMLVYVRESDLNEILAPVEDGDIPEHLRVRFDEERLASEQRRKDKEEQHLYMTVKALFDEQIKEHPGFDLCNFDEKAFAATPLPQFKVRKDESFGALRARLAEHVHQPVDRIRVWSMLPRVNKTIRPDSPITNVENDKTVDAIRDKFVKNNNDLRLYVEIVDPETEEFAVMPSQAVIFIKFFDPSKDKIQYVGKIIVKNKAHRIQDYVPRMLELAGCPPDLSVRIFEEIKPDMIDPIDGRKSFAAAELGDGDILCFQVDMQPDQPESMKDPNTVQKYFERLRNRQNV
ncbi:hypothetical protein HDU76_012981, partial [Blyttiomyces sp. JEL0837]